MEYDMTEAEKGREGLYSALVFIFFLVGSLLGKQVLAGSYPVDAPLTLSMAVYSVLTAAAIAFSGSPLGIALLPICSLASGVFTGVLADRIVLDYFNSAQPDIKPLLLCAAFAPAFFAVAESGMRSSAVLREALDRCGEPARAAYSRAFVPIILAGLALAAAFYMITRI